ncbi:MAG: 4-hydroxybenzoyl-CoA thioesterase [Verrucomicrobiales bacterium]|nr:4-hydroxybenzoyl-CoA thioesterase [Verrucomicrobiales bacterium]
MAFEFTALRRVEFSDTDMAGIMHYSNFFRFMETAEHAFFRSLGLSIVMNHREPAVGWPRVHASCDYKRPLHFEDEVEIKLLIKEKRSKALTYLFIFSKLQPAGKIEVARGQLTVVSVMKDASGKMTACQIPAELAEKIEAAPPESLT